MRPLPSNPLHAPEQVACLLKQKDNRLSQTPTLSRVKHGETLPHTFAMLFLFFRDGPLAMASTRSCLAGVATGARAGRKACRFPLNDLNDTAFRAVWLIIIVVILLGCEHSHAEDLMYVCTPVALL